MQFETPACTISFLYQDDIRESRLIQIHFNAIANPICIFMGRTKSQEALPEITKDTIQKKMFLKVLSCIHVFVFESKKSKPKVGPYSLQKLFVFFCVCRM
jgi:hypothetical protein